ncbi:MAG: EAL domain-containing protein [Rubrivivax sp.]|nr:EAL domain-containing protein [Rubrivivax sp.]
MRIRGLFLHSHVARRVFWVLLLAALLPLAVFAVLAAQAWAVHQAQQQRWADNEYRKQVGLRAFDKLVAARATLAAHAASTPAERPAAADPAVRAVLARVATVSSADGSVSGDPALAELWRAQTQREPTDATRLSPRAAQRMLWWLPAGPGRPAVVLLAQRDLDHQRWWVAEVQADFLWADFVADGAAATLCVTDAQGAALRCPPGADTGSRGWPLFLDAGFGSPDWTVHGDPPLDEFIGPVALGQSLVLGAVATLLMIVALALVMVRRTLVPLEQLNTGTLRLAAGDWQARVPEGRSDEFGQLAASFNTMAQRIGRQVQTLEVQAQIDREILGGLDAGRAIQRVAQRMQAVLPGAPVAVLVRVLARDPAREQSRDATSSAWWAYDGSGHAPRPLQLDLSEVCATGGGALNGHSLAAGPWARAALGQTGTLPTVRAWCASWQDERLALLLAAPQAELDGATQQELCDLRDRTAVTLAAAEREHRLRERAVRDTLTGLLNRHGLHDACDQLLQQGQACSLLFVDLDGFKEVNDALGHTAGDDLLRQVAQRLRAAVPAHAVLARPGGDEFVLLLPAAAQAQVTPEALAETLCALLAQPVAVRGQLLHIGASIGVVSSPEDGQDRDELLRRADLAMYAAKGDGRGRWRRFEHALDAEASERAWIVRDLRSALDADALLLHYQPRLRVADGQVASTEALVRWPHPTRGMVPPGRFVPVAEDAGLIERLGTFVMDTALAQLRRWRDAGLPVGRMAVNVSARQLQDPQFAAQVLACVRRHGLQPQDLEVEITESLFAGDAGAVARALEPLRQQGVQVALDDFGTGYSSLSALQDLPVDVLKIDRSFVIQLGQRPSADAVVRAIISLAHALDKHVVAEGVETLLQEERLLALGCDELQGYRYARPMPGEQVPARLAQGFELAVPALA